MKYHLCLLDAAEDISELVQFEAYSDDIATEIAGRKAQGKLFELWTSNRLVVRCRPAVWPPEKPDGETLRADKHRKKQRLGRKTSFVVSFHASVLGVGEVCPNLVQYLA
jgi:hypothetical protein